MKVITVFLVLLTYTHILLAQDSLALKGTTYNKFKYQEKVFNFKELATLVTDSPDLLSEYNEIGNIRKKIRIIENLSLIPFGLGLYKLVSIPSQSSNFFVIGSAVSLLSIPFRNKVHKKTDALIHNFNKRKFKTY